MEWLIFPVSEGIEGEEAKPRDACVGHVCYSHDTSGCYTDCCTARLCILKHCFGHS